MQAGTGEKWGAADEAATFYDCTLSEIIRWAIAGLIPAYHLRSNDRHGPGWWFPMRSGMITPSDLRIREKYAVARHQSA